MIPIPPAEESILTFVEGGSRDGEETKWLGWHVPDGEGTHYTPMPDRLGRLLYVLVEAETCECPQCTEQVS